MAQELLLSTNRLLAALPETVYKRLEPYLTSISVPRETVFYEALEEIETVYFPQTALICLVNTLTNGTNTEVGIIGFTGTIGLEVILSNSYSYDRAVVQIPGEVLKISASILRQDKIATIVDRSDRILSTIKLRKLI